jgi:hypothetical protein
LQSKIGWIAEQLKLVGRLQHGILPGEQSLLLHGGQLVLGIELGLQGILLRHQEALALHGGGLRGGA